MPEGDYRAELARRAGWQPRAGAARRCRWRASSAQHAGAAAYTVGQRSGLGVALGERQYVAAIDVPANLIRLGRREDLQRDALRGRRGLVRGRRAAWSLPGRACASATARRSSRRWSRRSRALPLAVPTTPWRRGRRRGAGRSLARRARCAGLGAGSGPGGRLLRRRRTLSSAAGASPPGGLSGRGRRAATWTTGWRPSSCSRPSCSRSWSAPSTPASTSSCAASWAGTCPLVLVGAILGALAGQAIGARIGDVLSLGDYPLLWASARGLAGHRHRRRQQRARRRTAGAAAAAGRRAATIRPRSGLRLAGTNGHRPA